MKDLLDALMLLAGVALIYVCILGGLGLMANKFHGQQKPAAAKVPSAPKMPAGWPKGGKKC